MSYCAGTETYSATMRCAIVAEQSHETHKRILVNFFYYPVRIPVFENRDNKNLIPKEGNYDEGVQI